MERILQELFGKNRAIVLATVGNSRPCVRYVNAFYESLAFYVLTWTFFQQDKAA